MVRFYANGNLSGYGDDEWIKSIPQIGSEFRIYLDKDGKITNFHTGILEEEHIMIVDQIIYSPYIRENESSLRFGLCDVNIYLVDKQEKSEQNNID